MEKRKARGRFHSGEGKESGRDGPPAREWLGARRLPRGKPALKGGGPCPKNGQRMGIGNSSRPRKQNISAGRKKGRRPRFSCPPFH